LRQIYYQQDFIMSLKSKEILEKEKNFSIKGIKRSCQLDKSFKRLLFDKQGKFKKNHLSFKPSFTFSKNINYINNFFLDSSDKTIKSLLSAELTEAILLNCYVRQSNSLNEKYATKVETIISFSDNEQINLLIKKLTLSFTTKKAEAYFFIGKGVFNATKFHVLVDKNQVYLNISNVSDEAKNLLIKNENLLKQRLNQHEINLTGIGFTS
jgi:hypothetical protein